MAAYKKTKKKSPDAIAPEKFLEGIKTAIAASDTSTPIAPFQLLQSAEISLPILLIGPHHVRIKRTIDWLKEHLGGSEIPPISSYFGHELLSEKSVSGLVAGINSPSLFSKAEIVVIYDADKIRAAAAKPLADALQGSHQSSIVILTAEKFNKKSSLFSRLDKKTKFVEFDDLPNNKLARWIQREIKRCGNTAGIERDALAALTAYYGSDVTALSQEVEKLCLLTPESEAIQKQLVDTLSHKSQEVATFGLLNEVANKNVLKASSLTSTLLKQGFHPLQLSSFLSRCLRTVLAQRGSTASLAPELQNQWFLNNIKSSVRNFSTEDLVASITLLAKLDFALKDSGLPDALSFSIAIERLALRRF